MRSLLMPSIDEYGRRYLKYFRAALVGKFRSAGILGKGWSMITVANVGVKSIIFSTY
jgi:hypothetical protein